MKTQIPPPRPLTQEAAKRQNILVYSPDYPMESRLANFLRKHGFQCLYICSDPSQLESMVHKHQIHVILTPIPVRALLLEWRIDAPNLRMIDLPHRNGLLDETRWRKALIAALYRRSEGGVQ